MRAFFCIWFFMYFQFLTVQQEFYTNNLFNVIELGKKKSTWRKVQEDRLLEGIHLISFVCLVHFFSFLLIHDKSLGPFKDYSVPEIWCPLYRYVLSLQCTTCLIHSQCVLQHLLCRSQSYFVNTVHSHTYFLMLVVVVKDAGLTIHANTSQAKKERIAHSVEHIQYSLSILDFMSFHPCASLSLSYTLTITSHSQKLTNLTTNI